MMLTPVKDSYLEVTERLELQEPEIYFGVGDSMCASAFLRN